LSVEDRLVSEREDARDVLAHDGEVRAPDARRAEALDARLDLLEADGLAALEGAGHLRRSERLGAEDATPAASERDAREEAPAAERHEHGLDLGPLRDDLEPDRALALDRALVVVGRHE